MTEPIALPESHAPLTKDGQRPDDTYYGIFQRWADAFNNLMVSSPAADEALDAAKASKTQPWSESFIIESPEDGSRKFIEVAGNFTILETVTESVSGTCTIAFDIDGTPLGGPANAASSVRQTQEHDEANEHEDGQDIGYTVSGNADCLGLSVTFIGTKTLD